MKQSLLNFDPLFYPNNDKLTDQFIQSAKEIRLCLGEWPTQKNVSIKNRLCFVPEKCQSGDIVFFNDLKHLSSKQNECHQLGAYTLIAEENIITLSNTHYTYALKGNYSSHWLAAFAAFMHCGFLPQDALCLSMAWRDENKSWPRQLAHFPSIVLPQTLSPAFCSFSEFSQLQGIYPIVSNAKWVETLAKLGLKTLQLRIKAGEIDFIKREIKQAVAKAKEYGVTLFINDYWHLAIELGAEGVHLGQDDLATANLEKMNDAGLKLGISTHGYYEILMAWHFKPSYIALGAVFPTTTKVMPTSPQGLQRLAYYVNLLKNNVPTVAIGGIDSHVLADILKTGVDSVAVVRAITEAPSVSCTVNELFRIYDGYKQRII